MHLKFGKTSGHWNEHINTGVLMTSGGSEIMSVCLEKGDGRIQVTCVADLYQQSPWGEA